MIKSKKNVQIAKNVQISGIPFQNGMPDIDITLKMALTMHRKTQ